MNTTYEKIIGKITDYKICKKCGVLNWYENERCVNCSNNGFDEEGKGVSEWINKEYLFYLKEGYTENEIDTIEVEA